MQGKSAHTVTLDEMDHMMLDQSTTYPVTAAELSPGRDPRYAGLNRAQRRKAIAHERRSFRKRGDG